MRIWLITSSYPRNPSESINAGVVARDVALDLASAGHEVFLFTPDKPGGVQFDDAITGVRIPWLRPSLQLADVSKTPIDLVRVMTLLISARLAIRREYRKSPPDGILAFWALPSGIFARWASARAESPYVVWLLGSDVWRAAEIPMGLSALTRVLEDAAAVFADGRDLAVEAQRLTGIAVRFLPSACHLPDPQDFELGTIDVLYVGRFHPNKGPDVLVDALGILKNRGMRIRAEIYGSGQLESDLQDRIERFGLRETVKLEPPIDRQTVADRLASTRVLVIPSRIESIPLILGDAVQARTPVIASRVGDMGELVEELHIGTAVPPENAVALAEAIAVGLEMPRNASTWAMADSLLSPGSAISSLLGAFGREAPKEEA